jgi:hypothetical protein
VKTNSRIPYRAQVAILLSLGAFTMLGAATSLLAEEPTLICKSATASSSSRPSPFANLKVCTEMGDSSRPVILDASSSRGRKLRYTFFLGDGRRIRSAKARRTVSYSVSGEYRVSLQVRDSRSKMSAAAVSIVLCSGACPDARGTPEPTLPPPPSSTEPPAITPTATPSAPSFPTETPSATPTPRSTETPTLTPTPTSTPPARPTLDPGDVQPPLAPGQTAVVSSITQNSVVFHFASPALVGRFANGDLWVQGPVVVDSMDPPSEVRSFTKSDGSVVQRLINGHQLNAEDPKNQSFDERVQNWTPQLMPALPITLTAGDMLLKGISYELSSSGPRVALSRMSVLTVLSEIPPEAGAAVLRPPYYGPRTDRPLYEIDSILSRVGALPSLEPTESMPSLSATLDSVSRLRYDTKQGWTGEKLRPIEHMQGYGGNLAMQNHDALLRLLVRAPGDEEDKRSMLALYLSQYALDLIHYLKHGGRFAADGGHNAGRLAAASLGAYLINDEDLKRVIRESPVEAFQERDFFQLSADGTTWLFGDENSEISYWRGLTLHDQSNKTTADPYRQIDGGYSAGAGGYQRSANATSYKAPAIILSLIPEVATIANVPSLLPYVHRWVDHGTITQPDTCAPAVGRCVGGAQAGARCTSAQQRMGVEGDRYFFYNTACGEGRAAICGMGACKDGPYAGQRCMADVGPTGDPSEPCGVTGAKVHVCDVNQTGEEPYGVAYGPNGSGGCIQDRDASDGIGRLPLIDGDARDQGSSTTPFAREVWRQVFGN